MYSLLRPRISRGPFGRLLSKSAIAVQLSLRFLGFAWGAEPGAETAAIKYAGKSGFTGDRRECSMASRNFGGHKRVICFGLGMA
jgi:hypothetical protein